MEFYDRQILYQIENSQKETNVFVAWKKKLVEHEVASDIHIYRSYINPLPIQRSERGQSLEPEHSLASSSARTAQTIRDYILNNKFDYFMTFTFDPKKYNNTIHSDIYHTIIMFIQRLKRRYGEIKYLFVPEYHKDKKKIHLHALLSADLPIQELYLTTKKGITTRAYDKIGTPLYYLPDWNYGYSSATKISNTNIERVKIANYVGKYITKDLIVKFNQQRYWVSKGLKKPITYDLGFTKQPNLDMQWDYANKYSFIVRYIKD